jgi:putative acetyltransferase
MIDIRAETSADCGAIAALNNAAFGGEEEAGIVDRLRADGLVITSLVAEEKREIVGHIMFSELPIETAEHLIRGAALAPMAVAPSYQHRGIGSRLVRSGLEVCRAQGIEAVVVLGHPEYYPRFGFSAALAQHLRAPYSGPAFMALELKIDILEGRMGTVHYPDAFGLDTT